MKFFALSGLILLLGCSACKKDDQVNDQAVAMNVNQVPYDIAEVNLEVVSGTRVNGNTLRITIFGNNGARTRFYDLATSPKAYDPLDNNHIEYLDFQENPYAVTFGRLELTDVELVNDKYQVSGNFYFTGYSITTNDSVRVNSGFITSLKQTN
ncbi:hypothetical protein KFE98_13145 [bacterium SCSIO 12741]|nr:hypothetical protein KFE98_13145 [bacterium SCSIO 12741]